MEVTPYGEPEGAWQLTFEDDFDGDALDRNQMVERVRLG